MINFFGINEQYLNISNNINLSIQKVFNHKQFIMGDEVRIFENKIERYFKVKHCISCANGTDAISLVLKAWGIGYGDFVGVPAFTYVATAEAVRNVGAIPIFMDVNPNTFNIDKSEVKSLINFLDLNNLKVKAIIAVNLFGSPCEIKDFSNILKKNKIKLLIDGAQSMGSKYLKTNSSNFSDAFTTSFFPTKPLGCYGDGGAILTNNDNLAGKLKMLRIHGYQKSEDSFSYIGYNSRLDTIQAAILNRKIRLLKKEILIRNKIANLYIKNLDISKYKTQEINQNSTSAWAIFSIICTNRDVAIKKLMQNKIPYRIYYNRPIPANKAYKSFPKIKKNLINSKILSKKILSLPMHPYLNENDVYKICNILNN